MRDAGRKGGGRVRGEREKWRVERSVNRKSGGGESESGKRGSGAVVGWSKSN